MTGRQCRETNRNWGHSDQTSAADGENATENSGSNMSSHDEHSASSDTDAVGGTRAPVQGPFEWHDDSGRAWRIQLEPQRIVLSSGSDVIDLAKDAWQRDIYAAPHGANAIVRFSTFEHEIGFMIPGEQAAPLLKHVHMGLTDVAPEPVERETPPRERTLLWPKVSPLAVWALICSSIAFVPVLGLVPAIAAVILLVLHRRIVRRADAWWHSRALCKAAVVFLVTGLITSAVATLGLRHNVLDSEAPASVAQEASLKARGLCVAPNRSAIHATSSPGPGPAAKVLAQSEEGGILQRKHNWGLIAASIIVVLLSLSIHEAAHAISAWWLGDDFARRLGRVTLNPVAHIDLFGTLLLPLFLALTGMGIFGWARPVPVRTEMLPNRRRDHMLISLAGPGSNLLLAAASLSLLLFLGSLVGLLAPQATVTNFAEQSFSEGVSASGFALATVFAPVCTVLKLSFMINLFLAFLNLIPIPPLDGAAVLEHFFPYTIGNLYDRIRPFSFMILVLVLFSGLLKWLLLPGVMSILVGLLLLQVCTPF